MPTKTDDFLDILSQTDFTNRDLTFLFAEIRKMIESGAIPYKTLKFYCNWLLHSQKDRFHPEMRDYIREIYENAVRHIKNPMRYEYSKKISEFIYFEELKTELKRVLTDNNLPADILEGESWLNMIRVLVILLENQPMIKPIDEIESITFSPSAEGAAILIITFSTPVLDRDKIPHHYYKMGNYY